VRSGYAKIDITPPVGVELCGYGYYLKRENKGVHDPLFARAVAFELAGKRALLISCDLLGLSHQDAEAIKWQLACDTGIALEAVMLCCTHTHSGPAPLFLRSCGVMSEEYVRSLIPKLIEVGEEAFREMGEAESLSFAEAPVEGIAYNRTYGDKGSMDQGVRTLFVHRRGGVPIAIVNYACHPVANGVNDEVSADFPGQAVAVLEKEGFDSLYITGFCGDIDPAGSRNYQAIEKHGRAIAQVVMESAGQAQKLPGKSIKYGVRDIDLPLDVPSGPQMMEDLAQAMDALEKDPGKKPALSALSARVAAVVATHRPDFQDHRNTYVQTLMIDNVTFVAFPGETFTAFGDRLRQEFPGFRIFTVNTANGVIGYIPTADEFDRKGYASHLAATLYGIFRFQKGFGEQICDQAIELIRSLAQA